MCLFPEQVWAQVLVESQHLMQLVWGSVLCFLVLLDLTAFTLPMLHLNHVISERTNSLTPDCYKVQTSPSRKPHHNDSPHPTTKSVYYTVNELLL